MLSLLAHPAGDMSRGITSATWEVKDLSTLDEYNGQREEIRKTFADAFTLVAGEKVWVWFSDELIDPNE